MDEREFDKFADEYHQELAKGIKVSGEEPEYFAEYKVRDVARLTVDSGSSDKLRILDFGAGTGNSVPYFRYYFPGCELSCVDVSLRSLEIGETHHHGLARFIKFDGQTLPFPDQSFEVAFAACVFHHIDHHQHKALIKEIGRVLVPGGRLIIFEHNPYNPLTRSVVNNCIFDENAVLISATNLVKCYKDVGFEAIQKCYRVFFPGALRSLRLLEPYLGWLPLGAQYYVVGKKPKIC